MSKPIEGLNFGRVPPYLLAVPKISPDGKLDFQTWLSLFHEPGQTQLRDTPRIPGLLQDAYNEATARAHSALTHRDFSFVDTPRLGLMDPEKRVRATGTLITRIFPDLKRISNKREIFRGLTLGEYADQVALLMAFGFRDWVIKNHLAQKFHQPLSLLETVARADTVLDLARLYRRGTKQITGEAGVVFDQSKTVHEVCSLLGFTYVATIVDLSRKQTEANDIYLDLFIDDLDQVLPQNEGIVVNIKRDEKGQVVSYNTCSQQTPLDIWNILTRKYSEKVPFAIRRFGPGADEYIILESRQKDPYPEMFKAWRARPFPVFDLYGAHFTLGDRKHLESLITILNNKFEDWKIAPEEEPSLSPYSIHQDAAIYPKYYAVLKDDRRIRIEIQIDWLCDTTGRTPTRRASWFETSIEPGGNHPAYRMKQLLGLDDSGSPGLLETLFPPEYHYVQWKDPKVRQELMEFANKKAAQLFLR